MVGSHIEDAEALTVSEVDVRCFVLGFELKVTNEGVNTLSRIEQKDHEKDTKVN